MKVVYPETMLDRIRAARTVALGSQREIEKIVLTVAEARRLLNEVGPSALWFASPSGFEQWLRAVELTGDFSAPQPRITVMGIDIEVSR